MSPIIRHKGVCDYDTVWKGMIEFTQSRGSKSKGADSESKTSDFKDEIWILQHHPVFTQGTSCHDQPDPKGRDIQIVHTDRGGQITYHGPGQLIVYFLLDIKALNVGPKSLVNSLERLVIEFLDIQGIQGSRKKGAPGVYVDDAKIAALGLRISKGCCYHGLSINIDMDLTPYNWINPCGFENLPVTQIKNYKSDTQYSEAVNDFENLLIKKIRHRTLLRKI